MKTGRELDKLVAEVMGRRVVAVEGDYVLATEPGKPYDKLPEYSTDGNAAWEAWEWLEQNNPFDESLIMGRLWHPAPDELTAEFTPFVGRYGLDDIVAWGDTYPHAICLAVLATRTNANQT